MKGRGRIRAAWGASTVAPVITFRANDAENVDPSPAWQVSLCHSPALPGTPTRRGTATGGDMMLFGQLPCPATPAADPTMPADLGGKLAVSPGLQSDSDVNSFFVDISRLAATATATLPTKNTAAPSAAPVARRTGTAATVIVVAPIISEVHEAADEPRNHKPEVESRRHPAATMSCSPGDLPRSPDAAVAGLATPGAGVADAADTVAEEFAETEARFREITSVMHARKHATRRRPGAGLSATLAAARRAAVALAAERGSRTPSPVGRVPRKSRPPPMAVVRTIEPALQLQAPAPPGPGAAAATAATAATAGRVQTYVAVHSYSAKFADELTLSAPGQLVQVLEGPADGGWWRGRSDGGEGWFPANHVTHHVHSVPRKQRVVEVPWSTRPGSIIGASAGAGAEARPTASKRLRGAGRRSTNSDSSHRRLSLSALSSLLGSIPPSPTIAAPTVVAPAPAPDFDLIAPPAAFATPPSVAVAALVPAPPVPAPVAIIIAPATAAVVSATPAAAAGGDTLGALLVSLRKSKAGRQHGKPRAPRSVWMSHRSSAAVSPPAPFGADPAAGDSSADAARWDLYKATSARQDAAFEALCTRTAKVAKRTKIAADCRIARLEIELKQLVDRGHSSDIGSAAPPSPAHTNQLQPEDQPWMDIGGGGIWFRGRKALPNLPRPGSVRWRPRRETGVRGVRTASSVSSAPQSTQASTHAASSTSFRPDRPDRPDRGTVRHVGL